LDIRPSVVLLLRIVLIQLLAAKPNKSVIYLFTMRAIAAAQCIVIGPVCGWVGGCVCVFCVCVGGFFTMITRNFVHRSSPKWVCR